MSACRCRHADENHRVINATTGRTIGTVKGKEYKRSACSARCCCQARVSSAADGGKHEFCAAADLSTAWAAVAHSEANTSGMRHNTQARSKRRQNSRDDAPKKGLHLNHDGRTLRDSSATMSSSEQGMGARYDARAREARCNIIAPLLRILRILQNWRNAVDKSYRVALADQS